MKTLWGVAQNVKSVKYLWNVVNYMRTHLKMSCSSRKYLELNFSFPVKVPPTMTVRQLMQDPKVKQRLAGTKNHSLYEVICQEDLGNLHSLQSHIVYILQLAVLPSLGIRTSVLM